MDDLTDRLCDVPIFPLPEAVLLPRDVMPLHIFEPRYRELLADALAADGRFAIATLRRDGIVDDDPPGVHDEIGIGRVVEHEQLADGRSNLLLVWEGTAEIVEELATDAPYRRVCARLLPDADPESYALPPHFRGLAAQVIAAVAPRAREEVVALAAAPLTDLLARVVLPDADARRAYLRASGPARVAAVEAGMFDVLAASDGAVAEA
jgi:Lon protease-like protein